MSALPFHLLSCDFKCVQFCGTSYSRVYRSVYRSTELDRDCGNFLRIANIWLDLIEEPDQCCYSWSALWLFCGDVRRDRRSTRGYPSNPSELGGWLGVYFFIGRFGNSIGNPISGALLTSNYIWWKPALFSGIISLAGTAMYFIMRLIYLQRQKKNESQQNARTIM